MICKMFKNVKNYDKTHKNLILGCIVCGNSKFKFIFSDFDKYIEASKKEFFIFKCLKCNLITIDPKISEEDFDIYYPKNYIPFNLENKKENNLKLKGINLRDLLVNLFKIDKVKLELNKFKCFEKKYLDFGCGNGRHLIHIRAEYPKWELYGYDKSEFSRNNLKKNNFNLIDNLENIPDNFFDIINLSSVIEHLKYPILDITLLKKKMKLGGIIIIKTPNWKSFGRIIFRKNWINYDIPRHIYIFSSENLKKFLRNNGFEILRLNYSYNIGVELKSIYRALKIKKRPIFHNFLSKLFFAFGIFLNLTGLSSTITIVGKKND